MSAVRRCLSTFPSGTGGYRTSLRVMLTNLPALQAHRRLRSGRPRIQPIVGRRLGHIRCGGGGRCAVRGPAARDLDRGLGLRVGRRRRLRARPLLEVLRVRPASTSAVAAEALLRSSSPSDLVHGLAAGERSVPPLHTTNSDPPSPLPKSANHHVRRYRELRTRVQERKKCTRYGNP